MSGQNAYFFNIPTLQNSSYLQALKSAGAVGRTIGINAGDNVSIDPDGLNAQFGGNVQLGGATSSFPALRRGSGGAMEIILADGSDYTRTNAKQFVIVSPAAITDSFRVNLGSRLYSTVDGNWQLLNFAGTSFGLLQFGGTTSSFAALGRNGAGLDCLRADQSDYGVFNAAYFQFRGLSAIAQSSDGVLQLLDSSQTSFNRLQWGGTTTSFPALFRSGARLQMVLADNSDFSGLDVRDVTFKVTPVASLPAAFGRDGMRRAVNNATLGLLAGIGTVVAGGGANVVPVFCDGANWLIG